MKILGNDGIFFIGELGKKVKFVNPPLGIPHILHRNDLSVALN